MIPASPSCPAYAWTLRSPPDQHSCEVSLPALWGDYLSIGGSLSLLDFCRVLRVEIFVGEAERDLVAQALNEHLLEHGERFPIPYLREPPGGAQPSAGRQLPAVRARHRSH